MARAIASGDDLVNYRYTAPSRRVPLRCAHHLLLGHGLAAAVLRKRGGRVGITLNLPPAVPASTDPADRDAAVRQDLLVNRTKASFDWFRALVTS